VCLVTARGGGLTCTSAIGHQTPGTSRPHIGHRHTPNTRDTSAKAHRTPRQHLVHDTPRLGHLGHASVTPPPRESPPPWNIGHRRTSDSVIQHTGHIGQGIIGHRSPTTPDTSATHRPPTHLGLGPPTHGTLRPRHIGHWSPSTRDTSATHRSPTHLGLNHPTNGTLRTRHTGHLVTKHTGHLGHTSATETPPGGGSGLGQQTHGTLPKGGQGTSAIGQARGAPWPATDTVS